MIKSGAFLGLLLVFTLFKIKRKLLSERFRDYNFPSSGLFEIAIITLIRLELTEKQAH